MAGQISLGYMQPSDDFIAITNVIYKVGNEIVNPRWIEEIVWDYETPVMAEVKFEVNLQKLVEESGFIYRQENSGIFTACLRWASSHTKQKGTGRSKIVVNGENSLDFHVPGERIGGTIHLYLSISLADSGIPLQGQVVAKEIGNRIWEKKLPSLPLEGVGSRFSMTTVNFKEELLSPPDAMWLIQIENDLFTPAQAGVRVLLNSNHKTTLAHLDKPDTKLAEIWESFLQAEIITQLLLTADPEDLSHWEEASEEDREGTLGESISIMHQAIFPDMSLEDINADVPGVFAKVQAFVFNEGS